MLKKFSLWITIPLICLLLFILVYLSLFLHVWISSRMPRPLTNANVMVVLGCQVKADGTPSVQLLYRMQCALDEYNRHRMPIICTGGQGQDEPLPEGEFIMQWLLEKGVPKEDLIMETTSKTTKENLLHALSLIEMDNLQMKIITSDYHLPRSLSIAKDLGIDATGVGSPTKKEFFFKNYGREALAFGKYLLLKWFPWLNQWL